MNMRTIAFFLGFSVGASSIGCGGSAELLQSGDGGGGGGGGGGSDASKTADDASRPADDGSSTGTPDAFVGTPDATSGASDAAPIGASDAAPTGACPAGITQTSGGSAAGQPCSNEGQVCEAAACADKCSEPCNNIYCANCTALQCANATWQTILVPLVNCDAGSTTTTLSSCSTAADCRLFSNYCATSDCTCDAVGVSDPNPTCDAGTTNDCLQDPCNGMSVVCDATYHCALGTSAK